MKAETEIVFLRHGVTPGNLEKRYIGRTDEGISPEGIRMFENKAAENYIASPDLTGGFSLVVSPMKRCLQSAALLLGAPAGILEDMEQVSAFLRDRTDPFLYNYCADLQNNAPASRGISGAASAPPEKKESRIRLLTEERFRECDFGRFEGKNYRELSQDPDYCRWIESGGSMPFPEGESPADFKERCCAAFSELAAVLEGPALFVVHGGTIMSILERFAQDGSGNRRSYYDWHCENGRGYAGTLSFREKGALLLRITGQAGAE